MSSHIALGGCLVCALSLTRSGVTYTYQWCDFKQITWSLCALVFSPVKWDTNDTKNGNDEGDEPLPMELP